MSATNEPGDPDRPDATWHEPPPPTSYTLPDLDRPPVGYGQPGPFGAPGYPPFAGSSPTERNWAVGAHLSGFVAAWFALGFLGPLAVLLVQGDNSPFVRRHAMEALNFNLSILIYAIVSAALVIVVIGIVLLPIVGVIYLVSSIRGAIAASRGEDYRYPVTIRFVS